MYSILLIFSDEDEDCDTRSKVTYKEKRREAHTYAEQKRRNNIKVRGGLKERG